MRAKLILLLPVLMMMLMITANAQQPDEELRTRGSFLGTRPIKDETAPADKKKGAPIKKRNPRIKKSPPASSIGLGYTLYQRDGNNQPLVVDPSREFHTGDNIRITMEPNVDGYIYIFHHEEQGKPQMLFPDYRLNRGNNAIRAHVPYEIPSSVDDNPALRWFTFIGEPVAEHLYIVITRLPLTNVPNSEQLKRYCETHSCPWQPDDTIWGEIKAQALAPVKVSKSVSAGKAQSDLEQESIKRGLGLPANAPEPSIIRLSDLKANMLVTPIDLIHK